MWPWLAEMVLGGIYLLWCLEYRGSYYLSFLSCWVTPFLVLCLERAGFCGEIFCPFSLVFLGCQLLHLCHQSRIHEAKCKPRELLFGSLGSQQPCWSAFSLPLESSYVCFIYHVLVLLAILGRRNREKCVFHLGLEP